jgi:hypothetical protein
MRDRDIRRALHRTELARFWTDGESVVLDEFGICEGDNRVDIAVVNGALHGWEIKSERDTLTRLPAQMEAYSRVFDTVTIVVAESHIAQVRDMVPEWWGILEADYDTPASLSLRHVRAGGINEGRDSYAIAQLLWRDEALLLLRERGVRGKDLKAMRKVLYTRLTELYTLQELADSVRSCIKARGVWHGSQKTKLRQQEPDVV